MQARYFIFLVIFLNSIGFKCWGKNQKDEGTNSFHLHVSFAYVRVGSSNEL